MYNQAVQMVIDAGWELQAYNRNVLHAATYAAVREQLPNLQSSLVQCARDMASASLKLAKKKGWQCKKPLRK